MIAKEQEHRKVRTLPIDEETLEILRKYVDNGGSIKLGKKSLLFGISRHRGWQIVKECAVRAGLPELVNPESGLRHYVSPHRLRDAFAVNAVKRNDSGDGLRLLQEHLGHQNITTTMRYRKISGKEHRDWYNKLWQKDT